MKQTFFDFLTDPDKTCLAYIAHYFEQYQQAEPIEVADYEHFNNPLVETEMYTPMPWSEARERMLALTPIGVLTEEYDESKNHICNTVAVPYAELSTPLLISCCQVLHRKQLTEL